MRPMQDTFFVPAAQYSSSAGVMHIRSSSKVHPMTVCPATSIELMQGRRHFIQPNIICSRFSTSGDNSNAPKTETPTEQTRTFLLSLGYSNAISDGIIDALLQNGIQPTSLLSMVKSLAGRYEVDEDGGLKDLAASVKAELEKDDGKAKVKVWCLPSVGWSPAPDNVVEIGDDDEQQLPIIHSMDRAFAVEATEGTTLTDVAQFGTSENCDVLGEYLECACSGIMACSTCHVVIHPDWFDDTLAPQEGNDDEESNSSHASKVCPPSEAEQDMIDLAYEPQLTSRLGCQIKLTKELDGLVILLPKGSNNLMDHIPFE